MIYWIRQYFSRPENHLWALIEVLITFTMAVLPFISFYLIQSALSDVAKIADFWRLFERGQLYLVSYGLFGPIIWLAFVKPDVARHNARVFLGMIGLVVVFPIVGFLGIDPTISTLQNKTVVKMSYWLYGGFLFLNYLLIFYCTIEPPSAEKSLAKGSKDMREMYDQEYGT
ncbi:hypothetical protein [Sulfitobacter pontiacus]|uniref:hypothetical protein n=1 Tax=Sulfitobacter pontiacus TaxID=60137 RepID=UPI001FAB57A1|nr:hypothetical protein [Sulfitobacter pontiacus]